MGMTWEQFWEQDSSLVRDYREAKRLRLEEENCIAWLHGLYIYEALCNASPLFRAFSKSGTRAEPYPERPHEFEQKKPMTEEEKNEKMMQDGIAYMERMTARFNQSFYQKQRLEEAQEIMRGSDKNIEQEPINAEKGADEDGRRTDA